MNEILIKIGTVSAGYGVISNVHKTPHTGIDFAVPMGTPINAPLDGVVSRIADYGNSSLGKAIFVNTHGGKQYVIGHLSEIKVKAGQLVHQGDLLALSGSSGNSTGPHLHFGMFNALGQPMSPGNISFDAFVNGMPDPTILSSIGDSIGNFFGDKVAGFFIQEFDALITLLNANSAEIITLAVCVCAFGMMFGSMIGSSTGKWFGRLAAVLLGGVIWRSLI
jgi:hypothetical protein